MDCPLPGTFERIFSTQILCSKLYRRVSSHIVLWSDRKSKQKPPKTDQEDHISLTDHVHVIPSTNVLLLSLKNITHAKSRKVHKVICVYVNVSQVTEKGRIYVVLLS